MDKASFIFSLSDGEKAVSFKLKLLGCVSAAECEVKQSHCPAVTTYAISLSPYAV